MSGQTLLYDRLDCENSSLVSATGTVQSRTALHAALQSACVAVAQSRCPLTSTGQRQQTIVGSHTHTHPFNGPFCGTTQVGQYQKGKTNLDFTEARDSGWQWHQLGHMQVCTSLQTDNHASTSPLSFCRPDALPAAQPTASKH